MKVFVRKGSKVMVAEPTFPMYSFYTQLFGGTKINVVLKPNFNLDVESLLNRADNKTCMLFICSPNNPTGNQFAKSDVKKLLEEFRGVVVVDEAYVDFAKGSVINWIKNYENLVVLRSFSKGFGLAGLCLGYLLSNQSIVKYVQRVVGPFNLNSITQQAIIQVLQNWSYFKGQLDVVINERDWLMKKLKQIDGIFPFPSDANFILFKVSKENSNSSILVDRLAKKNVLVKDRGHLPLLENCIRVTVGSRNMNEIFIQALTESLGE